MITPEDLRRSVGMDLVLHAKLGNGGVYFEYRSLEFPRLTKTISRHSRGEATVTTYWVDGYEVDAALDLIAARLNAPQRIGPAPNVLQKLAATKKEPEPTVEEMLAEVQYELRQRSKVYARLLEQGEDAEKLGKRTKLMQAVRNLLKSMVNPSEPRSEAKRPDLFGGSNG
jgi:hypothetical protein